MESEKFDELIELFKNVKVIEQREINESIILVNYIIKYQYKDIKIISNVFDKMLSIAFISLEDIKDIYFKLLNYTKTFDEELAKDYKNILFEQFNEFEELERKIKKL